ncbi:hypothetical protein E2C01_089077 [Portunus trituberculatus]|uniref:Uncharacterized protein n=1 Tax=Portunus trituberculatus TaxID=210409 RepID=A0A5B7JGA9_PORTR|nr:hypothetical protein [Portunus trituberculatus]
MRRLIHWPAHLAGRRRPGTRQELRSTLVVAARLPHTPLDGYLNFKPFTRLLGFKHLYPTV